MTIAPRGCKKLSAKNREELPKLRAQGLSLRELGRLTGVSYTAIGQELALPENQAAVQFWRDVIKRAILQRTAEGLIDGAFDMAEDAITGRDAKSFDATSRGIAALEKASASASGENKRLEVSGSLETTGSLDVRALIGAVVEHIGGNHAPSQQAVIVEAVREIRPGGQESRAADAPDNLGRAIGTGYTTPQEDAPGPVSP